MKISAQRVMDALIATPWMITEEGLDQLYAIASRDISDISAVKSIMESRHPDALVATVRGNVGIVPVTGPIFPKANLMTEISGATALSKVALDFQTMLDDPEIDTVVMNFSSPGGVIDGIHEMSQKIRNSGKKVVAYVGSMAASAAYWWAAACDEIVIDATARLGSIGVVAKIRKENEEGVYEFVNTASPNKRSDITTKEGKKLLVSELDELADVFITNVADFRGVDKETVINDFNKGGMLVGAKAVEAGMADRLGSYEELIAELQKESPNKGEQDMDFAALKKEDLVANRKDLVDAFLAEGAADAKAESSAALAKKDEELAAKQEEIDNLSASLDTEKKANKDNAKRIAALEEKDVLRAEQDTKKKQEDIVSSALKASSLSDRLYAKVTKSIEFGAHVKDGELDEKGFTAHVKEEIADWEASVSPSIQGMSITHKSVDSDQENTASAEDDAIVSRIIGDDDE